MPRHRLPIRARRQRGSALFVTLILITVLLAGGTALVHLQLKSTRATDLVRTKISGTACAEAGLVAARPVIAASYAQWNAALANPGIEPPWLAGIDHDLDEDGQPDFRITLEDNDDEQPPAANDKATDSDLQVFVISTCTMSPDMRAEVSELVLFNGAVGCYDAQLGGCGTNGNQN